VPGGHWAAAVLGLFYVAYSYGAYRAEMARSALDLALSAEALIPKESIKALDAVPDDIHKPEYATLKEGLMRLRARSEGVSFIYLYTVKGAAVYFMADSEDPEIGRLLPARAAISGSDRPGGFGFYPETGDIRGTCDRPLGNLVQRFGPVLDPETGESLAVLGIDYPAARLQAGGAMRVLAAAANALVSC
jgi:hypothetical protein